ncbi:kinase-like domain-containing protein [Pavlovales sp. CCMP2436]|nr:kinase-like domain-containing protein [Pavlovales sp. CCMP2436]
MGSGGFGTVYAALHKGARRVAVKRLNAAGAAAAREFASEVGMLKLLNRLRHEHIVTFVGACPDSRSNVTELMAGGSLADVLKADPARLAWPAAGWRAALHIARALHYLHTLEPPVVHWDVKPDNVLCQPGLEIFKLADVGLANIMLRTLVAAPGYTPFYAASEVHEGGDDVTVKADVFVTVKADVFSFGVVVEAFLVGKELTSWARALRLPPGTSTQVRGLVKRCLLKEATARPSAHCQAERNQARELP